jgi:hypothetical protein
MTIRKAPKDTPGGRGPNISPKVRKMIYEEAVLNQHQKRRDLLARDLIRKIRNSGATPPGEDTLIKMISRFRKREPNPLDQPWTIESLIKYKTTPEALPWILKAWAYSREFLNHALTIRDAGWVERLYGVIRDVGKLTSIATGYAYAEMMAEILKQRFSTLDQDALKLITIMTGEEFTSDQINYLLDGYRAKGDWLGRQGMEQNAKFIKQAISDLG